MSDRPMTSARLKAIAGGHYGRDNQVVGPARAAASLFKRYFDLLGALLLLLALLPALTVVGLAIRLESPGPALFRQKRTGLAGRPFMVFKFRSMVTVAGQETARATAPATVDDTRITPLGRLLRRSSVDELPQLLNVLRGEMSLVGPRPHAIDHDEKYAAEIEDYGLRFQVRPGMTGLAQINGSRGGGEVFEIRRRLVLDRRYIEDWSLLSDLRILFLTVPHLIFFRAH